MEMYGYKPNWCLKVITWTLITLSGFVLRLIFSWRPQWMLYATHVRCPLDEATKVLLVDRYGQYFVENVGTNSNHGSMATSSDEANNDNKPNDEPKRLRYFENKKLRYMWDESRNAFVKLYGLDKTVTLDAMFVMFDGLTKEEQRRRRRLYGDNAIHVEVQPYLRILFQEVLGPFYIFQVFSMAVWYIDDYFYYGTCIIIMSVLSLVSGVVQIRRNQEQLRDTVESIDNVKVRRPSTGQYEEVESSQIVPGDVVMVPTFDTVLQFDAILINGNVIVNESMLTGESVPITKTPISANNLHTHHYDPKEHGKHTLYCGTRVLQTRYCGGAHVKALVIRSGFQTAKGELIRSIMFPKPVDFRFNRQINRFIGLLACLALVGFIYTVIIKSQRGATLGSIILSALDLITIVVPPALPAAMTIGIIYAQSRLKKNKIYCISPRSINISGSINCVCFDKTGTLTEDHLSFNEVAPVIEETCEFGEPFDESDMSEVNEFNHKATANTNSGADTTKYNLRDTTGQYSPLMVCLAACHSLTIIDHKLIGDPLDLQMFHATGWHLEETHEDDDDNKNDIKAPTIVRPPRVTPSNSAANINNSSSSNNDVANDEYAATNSQSDDGFLELPSSEHDVGILRQFTFSSSLQRMSVVTRQHRANQFVVYTKGAPEKIAALCDPETIPDDFGDVLVKYTRRGYRVLGLAYRPLPPDMSNARMQRATRTELEADLKFLGLLTLGNLLKPETTRVISTLNWANIRSVMVTGDNMLTALSVACDCQMIARHDKIVMLQLEKQQRKEKQRRKHLIDTSQTNILTAATATTTGGGDSLTQSPVKPSSLNQLSPAHSQAALSDTTDITTGSDSDSEFLSPKSSVGNVKPKLVWHYVTNVCTDDEDKIEATNNTEAVSKTIEGACVLQMPPDYTNNQQNGDTRVHVAITGETWDTIRTYYPHLLDAVCVRGTVFARMGPDQKQQLVEHLQSLQYYVGMCGDGANDSGALRSAHAGISLSDTEASVAAPFTSATANISCIPTLICEGRAALVTAFGILKYMALYSLIQFCSVIILYTMYTNLTDMQFLYVDLFIITLFVALFGRTKPYPLLAKAPPSSSLLSLAQLSSVTIQITLVVFFQLLAVLLLWQQPWYQPHEAQYDKDLAGYDNYAIFAVSVFQYITLAIVFSKGKPYRRPLYTNYLFMASIILMTTLTVAILLIPPYWNVPYVTLDVVDVPLYFKCIMIGIALAHFCIAMIGERFIVDRMIFRKSCDTGFGNLLARRLDGEGYKVFAFCLKPNGPDATKLESECSNRLRVIEMDVTNYETINRAAEIVERELNATGCKLLALVNNAGILSLGEVEFGATIEPFERQMDVNCLGVIRVTKTFCPLLRRCKDSRLVNVTSLAARISLPGMVGYCVSKCAALSFTDGIRIELMKWGIKTVSIEPHLFRTNLIGHQQKMFEKLWQTSRPITKQDYGDDFFEGAKRLLNRGTDSARSNIPDVIEAMYDSVTLKYPETHKKVCSSEFERIRVWFLIYVIPRALQDYLLYRGALFITGKPALLTQKSVGKK
ncbi:putative cation-transporting ATPase 13A3 [Fragariocoptes setiger]|uniref:Cation-transporting ATPase n=1 Tax=Fragariocoptes setiger TaxID=1670756 RepID=A0ABQ7S7R9_9ACAR|nr:putative cation-transporting ATPase 13A3 [Fragariocoptes setiger]